MKVQEINASYSSVVLQYCRDRLAMGEDKRRLEQRKDYMKKLYKEIWEIMKEEQYTIKTESRNLTLNI